MAKDVKVDMSVKAKSDFGFNLPEDYRGRVELIWKRASRNRQFPEDPDELVKLKLVAKANSYWNTWTSRLMSFHAANPSAKFLNDDGTVNAKIDVLIPRSGAISLV